MIDFQVKYQATIFVNAEDITPSPDIMSSLIDIFRDKGLIPSTFQELRVPSPIPKLRIRLSTSNNEWNISFATNRINIDKNPTDLKGSNLGELSNFCLNATDFFERILNSFNKRANRLGLNTNSLLEEMSEAQLSRTYAKLFIPPQFYEENPPFEWNWRSVARIPIELADLSDTLYVITTINRARGEFGDPSGITKFDRLQLLFDINTTDQNIDYRFNLSHIKSYFQQAPELHNSLCEQMLEYVNV